MVLDSTKYRPDEGTELYEFVAQAKAEALHAGIARARMRGRGSWGYADPR